MKYFEVFYDVEREGHCWLNDPKFVDNSRLDVWAFNTCRYFDSDKILMVTFRENLGGDVLDLNMSSFNTPIVTKRISRILHLVAPWDVQLIPVRLIDTGEELDILNILPEVDCLDQQRSSKSLVTMRIDPTRTEGHHIFRIKDHRSSIVISETIREALRGATGILIRQVTED